MKFVNLRNFCKKVSRFGLFIPLSNLFITYGQGLLSHRILTWLQKRRTNRIQTILETYLIFPETLPECPKSFCGEDAKIWFFWLQGEDNLPLLPKFCLESMRGYANGHEVVVLSADNYSQYVQIPESLIDKYRAGRIKAAHFADILRINILAQQGGLWLDATMLVTQKLPKEIFERPFFSIKTENKGYFVSQCRWAVFCLGAQKGSALFTLLSSLFEQYMLKTDVFVDYFLFDNLIDMIYLRYPSIRQEIDDVPMNNACVHDLEPVLCDEIDDKDLADILKETYLFKLSYKSHTPDVLHQNTNNVYNKLMDLMVSDFHATHNGN